MEWFIWKGSDYSGARQKRPLTCLFLTGGIFL